MNTGLIWFICLALVVMFLAFAVVGWLNYKENPLYWRDQKKMLEASLKQRYGDRRIKIT